VLFIKIIANSAACYINFEAAFAFFSVIDKPKNFKRKKSQTVLFPTKKRKKGPIQLTTKETIKK
jgi:hypothetical protein